MALKLYVIINKSKSLSSPSPYAPLCVSLSLYMKERENSSEQTGSNGDFPDAGAVDDGGDVVLSRTKLLAARIV